MTRAYHRNYVYYSLTWSPTNFKCRCSHTSRLDHFLNCIRRIDREFDELTGRKPTEYIEEVYSIYEAQVNEGKSGRNILETEISKLGKLQQSIERWGAEVLQLAGVGNEWNEVEGVKRRVRIVVAHLEEILCEAMVDPQGLVESHRSHNLGYQQ